jgi:hypothetical protein
VACKFTAHFSTLFSTTRTCRGASVALPGNFFVFLFSVVLAISLVRTDHKSIWKQANRLRTCYSDRGVITTFSSFRSSDLSRSI